MPEQNKEIKPKSLYIKYSIKFSIFFTLFIYVGIIIPVFGIGLHLSIITEIAITILLFVLILWIMLTTRLKMYRDQFLK